MSASFTLPDTEIFIASRGDANGFAAKLCCTATATITFTEDVVEFTCNPANGPVDRLFRNPSASIEIEDQNFNATSLRLSMNLDAGTSTDNYLTKGVGTNPATTPTSVSTHVDGPYTPTYVAHDAVVALGSAFVVENSVHVWSYSGTTFTEVATASVAYTDATIGKITITDSADTATIYFTYKYMPLEAAVMVYRNAFSSSRNDFTIVIRHTHADGDNIYDFVFWKCKPDLTGTFNIHDIAGNQVNVPMKFQALSDTDLHNDSPLYAVIQRSSTLTATPLIECSGDITSEAI